MKRRQFISHSLAISSGFLGLQRFASAGSDQALKSNIYGDLQPDPLGILELPPGFSYQLLSKTGDPMSDGFKVPGMPDGMGAFAGPRGKVLLVCNHELESKSTDPEKQEFYRKAGPFGSENELFDRVDASLLFDAGGESAFPSLGGTTTLVYDPVRHLLVSRYLSLAGTERNCAGGITPWGTWITCEESRVNHGDQYAEDHGYPFEVQPRIQPKLQKAVAYRDMGRFNREAVAVDPVSGIVYQTEDVGDGLFYRFIPNRPGDLKAGGRLQALALADRKSADTRNWESSQGPALPEGQALTVRWIDMQDVRSPEGDLRLRGFADGAAVFARGEGIWYGNGAIYFACTNGGRAELGQIFKYTPSLDEGTAKEQDSAGRLELFIESKDDKVLRNADNLTVAPWGDIIFCEDRSEESHIRGITPHGKVYDLARNALNGLELAGACFAPNHPILFVNLQRPGLTVAIRGPWQRR